MKRTALLTGALCAISSGAFAQSAQSQVIIPAFENRFAGIHQPVVALNTINRSAAFERQTFGGSIATPDPAARGVVTSPTAAAPRQRLDPTVMNVPVFPGNTAILLQQQGALGGGRFPNAGLGNTGFFIQQGSGRSLVELDPNRTVATPAPAVNAVPTPGALVPRTPQLQPPSPTTTTPVQQQLPTVVAPAQPVIQGQSIQGQGTTNQNQSGQQQPNR